MTVRLLRTFGYDIDLTKDIEYGIGRIKLKPEHIPSLASTVPVSEENLMREYYGYRPENSPYIFKAYQFAREKETDEWRRATEPREIKGHFRILVLTNPVVYVLTTVKRVAEAILIVTGMFFDMFAQLYPQKSTDNLTKAFVTCLNATLEKKKKEFRELWETMKNDFHCAAVMELAAIHGLLNDENATRMQFLFGDKERQWNSYKDADTFKDIEFDKTAPHGVSMIFSKFYNTKSPLLWIYMVKEAKEAIGVEYDSEELVKMISENRAGGLDMEAGLMDHIGWLDNNVDSMREARVKKRDIELLQEVIQSSKFKDMDIRALTASSELKTQYLWKYFQEIFETRTSGFIQYECAYPLYAKQDRVEVIDYTIKDSITDAWEAFGGS